VKGLQTAQLGGRAETGWHAGDLSGREAFASAEASNSCRLTIAGSNLTVPAVL
jgi:hypothetical protein